MKKYNVTTIYYLSAILVGVLFCSNFAMAFPSEYYMKRQADALKRKKLNLKLRHEPIVKLSYQSHRFNSKTQWIEKAYKVMPFTVVIPQKGLNELTNWTAKTQYINKELTLFYKKQTQNLKDKIWASKANFFRKTGSIKYMSALADELYLNESEFKVMTLLMVNHITNALVINRDGFLQFKKGSLATIQAEQELSQQQRQKLRNEVKKEVKIKVNEIKKLVTHTLGNINDKQSLLYNVVNSQLDDINKTRIKSIEGKKVFIHLDEQLKDLKKKNPTAFVAIAKLQLKIKDKKRVFRKRHAKQKKLAMNAGRVISYYSLFVSIANTKEGDRVHAIGQASAIMTTSVDKYIENGTGRASIETFRAIGAASFDLFKALQYQFPRDEQIIIEQIKTLAERVEAFRMETDSQFDRTGYTLDPMYRDLTLSFIEFGKEINNVHRRTQIIEDAVTNATIRMASQNALIATMMLDDLNMKFESARLWCSERPHLQRNSSERHKELTKCVDAFVAFALTNTTHSDLTGFGKPIERLDIQRGDYEYNINKLADYFGSDYKKLPNPLIWALGADAYMSVIKKYPEINLTEVNRDSVSVLLEQGRKINKFVLKIQKEPILLDIISQYDELFEEIIQQLDSVKKEYYRKHFNEAIQSKHNQTIKTAHNQKKPHKLDTFGLKKEQDILKEINIKLQANPVDFYDDLLSMDSTTENIFVNHGATVSPCYPSRNYPNSNSFYTISVPTFLRDTIFLSREDVEKLIPIKYRKVEAFDEGILQYCYDIDGYPDNRAIPIGTIYSCVECVLEDFFRYRLEGINFYADFTFKDGETIRVIEKRVPITSTEYLSLDIEKESSFLVGFRGLWHNSDFDFKGALFNAENLSKKQLESNVQRVTTLTHDKETDHLKKVRNELRNLLKDEMKEEINTLEGLARKIGALSYFGLNRSFNSDDHFWNLLNSLQTAKKLTELVLSNDYLLNLNNFKQSENNKTAELKQIIDGKLNDLRNHKTDEAYTLLPFMLEKIERFENIYNGEGEPPFKETNIRIEYDKNPNSKALFSN